MDRSIKQCFRGKQYEKPNKCNMYKRLPDLTLSTKTHPPLVTYVVGVSGRQSKLTIQRSRNSWTARCAVYRRCAALSIERAPFCRMALLLGIPRWCSAICSIDSASSWKERNLIMHVPYCLAVTPPPPIFGRTSCIGLFYLHYTPPPPPSAGHLSCTAVLARVHVLRV